MDDDDDFTFPTTAAATAPEGRGDVVVAEGAGAMKPVVARVPGSAAAPAPGAASSRLWPFAAPPLIGATTAATATKEDEAPTVADNEDRMDMLWDTTVVATKTETKSGARAEPQEPQHGPASESEPAAKEEERMDLLWESFNEELLLLRQRASSSKASAAEPDWYLCPSSTSDADDESEEASAVSSPGRARYGCAPTMLRASSRAGAAGQFYGSPRRRSRSRGGGWALLLRLFRRLFAGGDKQAEPRRHQSVYVP